MDKVNTLDLICRKLIGKGLPILVLRQIYELINDNSIKQLPYLVDSLFIERGARYRRKKGNGFQTNVRYKRAFRYGR